MTEQVFARPLNILSQAFNNSAQTDIALESSRATQFKADHDIKVALQTAQGDLLFGEYGSLFFKPAATNDAYEILAVYFQGSVNTRDLNGFSFQIRDELDVQKKLGEFRYYNGRGVLTFENGDSKQFKPLDHKEQEALVDKILDNEIKCIAQPVVRTISDAFDIGGGEQLIVSTRDGYGYRTESTSAFIKNGDDIRQLEITRIDTYSDGGTVFLNTTEGTLYIPSPFGPGSTSWATTPTWKDQPVTAIDAKTVAAEIGDKNPKVQGYKKAATPKA